MQVPPPQKKGAWIKPWMLSHTLCHSFSERWSFLNFVYYKYCDLLRWVSRGCVCFSSHSSRLGASPRSHGSARSTPQRRPSCGPRSCRPIGCRPADAGQSRYDRCAADTWPGRAYRSEKVCDAVVVESINSRVDLKSVFPHCCPTIIIGLRTGLLRPVLDSMNSGHRCLWCFLF